MKKIVLVTALYGASALFADPVKTYSHPMDPRLHPDDARRLVKAGERAAPFLRRLHALRPGVPILLCEGPEASGSRLGSNVALKAVYDALAKEGSLDGKLSYLPAAGMLSGGDATHDYIHPNDVGSATMAAVFVEAIAKAIGLR